VFSNLFASKPLGNAAENMAIGIVFGKSGKKVLVTGFRGDEYEDFFDATWWNERSAPVRSVARGSHEFRICDARYQFLQNDYLSLRSGADYEQFLAWNGKSFWPEPISPTSPPCGEKKF
jgi:hypothetical protein